LQFRELANWTEKKIKILVHTSTLDHEQIRTRSQFRQNKNTVIRSVSRHLRKHAKMTSVSVPAIIAISGRSGSGMTTTADAVVKKLRQNGVSAQDFSFMDPVYGILANSFHLFVDDLKRNTLKFHEYPGSTCAYHTAALDMYSALRIGHDELFFVRVMEKALTDAKAEGVDVAVIDDVRALPDKRFLEQLGAKFVRLSGSFAGDSEQYSVIVQQLDLLETELDEEDWEIEYKDLPLPCDLATDIVKKLGAYLPSQQTDRD